MADLIVVRRYLDGGVEYVEEITWRHVPDPEPRWRWVRRRFRSPKLVEVPSAAGIDERGRPLPGWCAPDFPPNRWLWIQASRPAADLGSIEPDGLGADGTKFYNRDSPYWDYYGLPLRPGVVLTAMRED